LELIVHLLERGAGREVTAARLSSPRGGLEDGARPRFEERRPLLERFDLDELARQPEVGEDGLPVAVSKAAAREDDLFDAEVHGAVP
jgi:hypothetical protein